MFTMTFEESAMSKTQVQLCYNRFKEGRDAINVAALPGRQRTSTTDKNIETVKKMILNNRRITTREVVDDVGISFGLCQTFFKGISDRKSPWSSM